MHKQFMKEALIEAKKAYQLDEVPIGCVIVCDNQIIARAYNSKIKDNNSLCHAEIKAIDLAMKHLGTKYLYSCTMYVTIEPCAMCAGAMLNARIGNLVFGAREPKTGCCVSVYPLLSENKFNHHINIEQGIMQHECASLMQKFFIEKRKNKC